MLPFATGQRSFLLRDLPGAGIVYRARIVDFHLHPAFGMHRPVTIKGITVELSVATMLFISFCTWGQPLKTASPVREYIYFLAFPT